MPFKDEIEFEKTVIDYLTKDLKGWQPQVIKYPTEEDLIKNWAEILFMNNNSSESLNNCRLTEGEMEQVLLQVVNKSPIEINRFINGKTVTIKRDNINDKLNFGKYIPLKIYDRKEVASGKSFYQIAEQPKFKTNNSVYPNKRGDFMLLINGMPMFHCELKDSYKKLEEGEGQIGKYSYFNCFTGIFSLIQIFVAMTPEESVYFANPGIRGKFDKNYFFHWEDFNNDIVYDWKEFTKYLLSIPMAHQLIGFYTIPDANDNVLKVMRSYQYYATCRITDIVEGTSWTAKEKYGGYVWHTTGSGKTLTSFKAAQLIANRRLAHKVIFLIDRIELGEQSALQFKGFKNVEDDVIETESTKELKEKLLSKDLSDTLIVTSIQKMSRLREDGLISNFDLAQIQKKHIVFIIDECHRDQKGDMHRNIKKTFQNAIYFGFSGTPDLSVTKDLFGNELHRYTIVHGIRDHNVLGFDPYKVTTFRDSDLRQQVAFRECGVTSESEAIKDSKKAKLYLYLMDRSSKRCPMTEIEKHVPKEQYSEGILGERHRTAVVNDILSKWESRSYLSKFHAILATSSIKEAIKYYSEFKKQIKEKDIKFRVTAIFDPTDNNNESSIEKIEGVTEILLDYKNMFKNFYDVAHYHDFKKDVCLRLSHNKAYSNIQPDDVINLVIVVDQLLTGFDSKFINTVYFDKVLEEKNIIQAMSRTNRLYKDEKHNGVIVSYRYPHTMEKNINEAIKIYSGDRPAGIFVNRLFDNVCQMNLIFNKIKELFESVGIKNFEKNYDSDDWREEFKRYFSHFKRTIDSALLQEFDWEYKKYANEKDGEIIELAFTKQIYEIIYLRFKEIIKKNESTNPIPFDIYTNIDEVRGTSIDDTTLNERFNIWKKNLTSNSAELRDKAEIELHKFYNLLEVEDQQFADRFLHDLQSGDAKLEEGLSFTDYINKYKCKNIKDNINKICKAFVLDPKLLSDIINKKITEKDDSFSYKYKELMKGFNIDSAMSYLVNVLNIKVDSKRRAMEIIDIVIRSFINNGGFDLTPEKVNKLL